MTRESYLLPSQAIIKILFLAANPQDSTRLQIDEEMRAVDQALRMTPYRDRFDLRSHWAVRYSDLQELLLRYQPHIIHFSGHGSQAGELILQSEGGSHPVTPETLSTLFAILKDNLRCVVLNACYSERQAQAIAAHIDCVIGMSDAIADKSSLNFAPAFYRALGYGRSIREAFDLGCNAIDLANLDNQDVPKLLALHADPAQLVLLQPETKEATNDLAPAPGVSPYKGLEFFDVEDADIFYGREQLTAELITLLRHQRFLAVVGASGSGKSSVVRAGLVAALQRGSVRGVEVTMPKGSQQWPVYVLMPGARPLESLAIALTRHSETVTATSTLLDDLRADVRSLHLYVSRLLSGTPTQQLLLVVDQFEEMFTLCRDVSEQHAFVDVLLTAALDYDRTVVVLTLRADFYAYCARFEKLRAALDQYQKYIGPLSEAELQQTIEAPASQGGWTLELGLVQQMLADIRDEPGSLPLLSHALDETWKRRRGRQLTLAGYVATGGVKGAIAHTADATYQDFSPAQQALARAIFLRLTELGEGVQDTRRRVASAELQFQSADPDQVTTVLKSLADARLVTTDANEVQMTHEALIREWPRLREWLADDREGLRIHRRLTEAAHEWQMNGGKDPNDLYRGNHLSQAQEWAANHAIMLNQTEQAFLQASQAEAEAQRQREAALALERETNRQHELDNQRQLTAEQKRRAHLFRTWSIVAGILFLLATFTAGVSLYFYWLLNDTDRHLQTSLAETKRNANIALSRQLAAQSMTKLGSNNYELAILLAIESGRITDTLESFAAIRAAIASPWHTQTVFYGHMRVVNSVMWSKDESKILTGSYDGTARIWDVATGKELIELVGHTDAIWQAVWNKDESKILTSSSDKTARIWDAATGQELVEFRGHTDQVSQAVWNKDESKILTSSSDKTARIWDAATGQELVKLIGHSDVVRQTVWSKDESKILTSSNDGTARIWDAISGKELVEFSGHTDIVPEAMWNKDESKILTSSGDGTARIWDAATGQELVRFTGHTDAIWQAVWNKDESKILTSSSDKTARIWDTATGQELVQFIGHTDTILQVVWSKDESRILTRSSDKTVRIWDAANGKELVKLIGYEDEVWQAVWNKDESKILIGSYDGTARIWDATSGKELVKLTGHAGTIWQAVWSKDESKILTSSDDKIARIWDATIGKELAKFVEVDWVVWSKDESKLLTINDDNTVHIWDIASSNKLVEFRGHTDFIQEAVWSKDESRLLTRSIDKTVRIWDTATGKELVKLVGHTDQVSQAVWSKDESKILTTSSDKTARIWDATTGKELAKFTEVDWVMWSKDESKLLTINDDNTIHIWDTAAGKELVKLVGHTDQVSQAVWSKDESKILTTSSDETARIWDIATGKKLVEFAGVARAVWSKDESKLLTTSSDGTAHIWDIATGKKLVNFSGVFGAVWSKDESKVLARRDNNKTIRIWDAATGKALVEFTGVSMVRWSKDQNKILTVNDDNSVQIWYVHMTDLLAAACTWTPRNFTKDEWQTYMEGDYQPTCPNVPIPPDVIDAIKAEASEHIRSGQIVTATRRIEQLNVWLRRNGQFKEFGVEDIHAFVTRAFATATPIFDITPTPQQPISPLPVQPSLLVSMLTSAPALKVTPPGH